MILLSKRAPFMAFAILALLSYFLIDLIPVNTGKGWDGNLFFSIIVDWSNGTMGAASEPYRFMRMGAFLPLVGVQYAFHSEAVTMIAAKLLAVLLSFSSIALIYAAYLRGAHGDQDVPALAQWRCAAIVTASILAHAVFTMPSHYPLLSDHFSLFIAGLSVYLWTLDSTPLTRTTLSLVAAYGFFVMPLVSLVPLTLLVFPMSGPKHQTEDTPLRKYARPLTFALSAVIALIIFYAIYENIPVVDDKVLLDRGGSNVSPAILDIKLYSFMGVIFVASSFSMIISWLVIRSLNLISWSGVSWAAGAVLIAASLLLTIPDWTNGMGGPRLLINMIIQGLHSPLNGLVSLFAYFGPIGIFGIIGIWIAVIDGINKNNAVGKIEPLALIATSFIFLALVGNETRQFIAVYPLLVFIALWQFQHTTKITLVLMSFAIVVVLVGQPIAAHVASAMTHGSDFLAPDWQSYFGRQGPWMSTASIILYQSLLNLFLLVLLIVGIQSKPAAIAES